MARSRKALAVISPGQAGVPTARTIACLQPKGIGSWSSRVAPVDPRTAAPGMVSQLVWSPDGKWFTGTAMGLGAFWNIGVSDATTGRIPRSARPTYNCTPDRLPDGARSFTRAGSSLSRGGRAEALGGRPRGAASPVRSTSKPHATSMEPALRRTVVTCSSPGVSKTWARWNQSDHAGPDPAGRHADVGEAIASPDPRLPDAHRVPTGPRTGLGTHWTFAPLR